MKNKNFIFRVLIIVILIVIGAGLYNSSRHIKPPSVITRSIPQGDLIQDQRSAIEACSSIIQEIQNTNPDCKLIESKRIDSRAKNSECVDGQSIAGCFNCKFECK